MGVGAKIKAILKQQKKTIKQLSEESGVSINTLYSITKRDSGAVTYSVLQKVAEALSIPVVELLPDKLREQALYDAKRQTELFNKEYNDEKSDMYHSETLKKLLSQESNLELAVGSAIEFMPINQEIEAQEKSDAILVAEMDGLPDNYIKGRIIEQFNVLNRRGKIEAMLRVDEIAENPRFHELKSAKETSVVKGKTLKEVVDDIAEESSSDDKQ